MQILILGCGYLGGRVAAAYHADGHAVTALTRSPQRAADFHDRGWMPVVGDVTELLDTLSLPAADIILYAVGCDRSGEKPAAELRLEGLGNVLHAFGDRLPERFVYVSSTGVYGQTGGEEVDESSPTEPSDDAGRAVLPDEPLLCQHCPAAIRLRFAGPQPRRTDQPAGAVNAGEPIPGDADGWLNPIHVDDGVRAVRAAAERGEPGAVYNVSDGHPVRRRDFYAELARLLGTPAPHFAGPPVPGAPNRRIVSRRLREELGVDLAYPSYVEGLRQAVNAG